VSSSRYFRVSSK